MALFIMIAEMRHTSTKQTTMSFLTKTDLWLIVKPHEW